MIPEIPKNYLWELEKLSEFEFEISKPYYRFRLYDPSTRMSDHIIIARTAQAMVNKIVKLLKKLDGKMRT